jgi:hypothetical protein
MIATAWHCGRRRSRASSGPVAIRAQWAYVGTLEGDDGSCFDEPFRSYLMLEFAKESTAAEPLEPMAGDRVP